MKKYFLPIIFALTIGFSTASHACWYHGASLGVTRLKMEDMRKMYFAMDDDALALNICCGYDAFKFPIRLEQQICLSKHYCDSDVIMGFNGLKRDIPMYSCSIIENVLLDIGFEKLNTYIGVGIGYHYSRGRFVDYLYGSHPHKYTVKIKKLVFQTTMGMETQISADSNIFVEHQYRFSKDKNVKEQAVFIGVKTYI